ncbi:MAG: hypothetical protein PSX36_06890 [bacterium]|nr:hypothetical protein [bacterium]
MRNKLTIFLLFIFGLTYAQAPLRINYQGVMRGSDGAPVISQSIGLKFAIYQGGNTTTATYNESQGTVSTNSLGLILTQIGKNGNLATINWQNGPFFLEVLVDNGSSFVSMGLQEILSVPFSMHAKTVPATYTNNLLTVGGNTFTLPPAATITPLGILNMTSTTTNSFVLDVPAPSFTSAGPVTITGTYPNLTVSSPTVPPSMTVTPSGIVNVTNTALNSVVVGVPSPTFTSVGPSSITGTYPNLTLTSPSVAPNTTVTANAVGIATVSNPGLNNFVVGVPQPIFTAVGATSITGVYPNLTVNSPAATPPTSVSANAAGIATVSSTGTNSFVVGVPQPTFTSVGPTTISGVYPNLTVTTPTIAPTTTLNQSGAVTITTLAVNRFSIGVPQSTITVSTLPGTHSVSTAGTNSFNINVPQTNITVSNLPGTTSVSTIGTNTFNINVPPGVTPVTPSVVGAGAAVVSPTTGNSFTVTVPQANVVLTQTSGVAGMTSPGTNSFNINIPPSNLTSSGIGTVTSAGTNSFNINIPQSNLTSTGIGTITSAGTNSFNINIPQTNLAGTGAATVTGAFPNYTVNAPAATPNTSLVGTGAAAVATLGINSYSVDVPQSTLTASGIATVTAIGTNSFNVNVAQTNMAAAGVATLGGAFPNYTVGVPASNIAVTTATGVISMATITANNFSLNIPPAITPTLTGTGLASVTPAGNSFTVNVPVLTYTSATAGLGSGTNSVSILQALSVTGGTLLQSGPASNTISLAAISPWRQAVGSTTLTNITDKVGIGTNAPAENLQVESATSASLSLISGATQTSEVTFGTTGNHILGRMRYNNTTNEFSLWTGATADRLFIDATGNVGMGTNLPVSKLDVAGNLRLSSSKLYLGAVGGVNSGYAGVYESAGSMGIAVFKAGAGATGFGPGGNSLDALFIKANTGEVGLGTINPIENLQVETAVNSSVSVVSGGTNTSDILFGTTATHGLGRVRYDNSSNTMSFWTNSTSRASINSSGQMIIGNNVPVLANTGLLLSRNGAFDNRLVITGGDNSNTYGGMINFAENLNHVGGMSLKLDAVWNRLIFTNDLAGASPVMAIAGYSGNSGVLIGPAYATLSPPVNGLVTQGDVGIGTATPNARLEVATSTGILAGRAQSIFYQNSGTGAAVLAESNLNGTQTGTTTLYARAFLAGWQNFPQSLGDIGVQGFGNTWGGAFSGGGTFAAPNTSVVLAGSGIAGAFMGGNVGIGTIAPTAALDVEGTMKITDGTEGANKVLTSDAAGNTTWENGSKNTGFLAYATGSQGNFGSWMQLTLGNEEFDDGNNFASNAYTAPSTGVYHFDAQVSWGTGMTVGNWSFISIYKNGSPYKYTMSPTSINYYSIDCSATVPLTAGDVITIWVVQFSSTASSTYSGGTNQFTYFSGYRLY